MTDDSGAGSDDDDPAPDGERPEQDPEPDDPDAGRDDGDHEDGDPEVPDEAGEAGATRDEPTDGKRGERPDEPGAEPPSGRPGQDPESRAGDQPTRSDADPRPRDQPSEPSGGGHPPAGDGPVGDDPAPRDPGRGGEPEPGATGDPRPDPERNRGQPRRESRRPTDGHGRGDTAGQAPPTPGQGQPPQQGSSPDRGPSAQQPTNQGHGAPRQQPARQANPGASEKDSGLSAILSFLIPGVGQFYNEQPGRGAVVLFVWVVWEALAVGLTLVSFGIFLFIWIPVEFVVHVVAAYDAYDQCEKIQAGKVVP